MTSSVATPRFMLDGKGRIRCEHNYGRWYGTPCSNPAKTYEPEFTYSKASQTLDKPVSLKAHPWKYLCGVHANVARVLETNERWAREREQQLAANAEKLRRANIAAIAAQQAANVAAAEREVVRAAELLNVGYFASEARLYDAVDQLRAIRAEEV